MGKTSRPLTILIDDAWVSEPAIQALQEKGHIILCLTQFFPALLDFDLILSEKAHSWHPSLWAHPSYLQMALKHAREQKRLSDRTSSKPSSSSKTLLTKLPDPTSS